MHKGKRKVFDCLLAVMEVFEGRERESERERKEEFISLLWGEFRGFDRGFWWGRRGDEGGLSLFGC
jgi:hypothetical protein